MRKKTVVATGAALGATANITGAVTSVGVLGSMATGVGGVIAFTGIGAVAGLAVVGLFSLFKK